MWSHTYGTPYNDFSGTLCNTSDGHVVMATAWATNGQNYTRQQMVKFDTSGAVIWSRGYGTIDGYLSAVKECTNGDLIASGRWRAGSIDYHGTLLRTNTDGDSLWWRSYYYQDSLENNGKGLFRDVIQTEDGGFIAVGLALHDSLYSADVWVVKVDSMGCIVPGCDGIPLLTSFITNLRDALNLFPVPLARGDGELHVSIKLPANFKTEGPLMLSVTSLDGKMLMQQRVPTSASDEVLLDVRGLSAGAYSLHLSDAYTWIAGKKFIVQ